MHSEIVSANSSYELEPISHEHLPSIEQRRTNAMDEGYRELISLAQQKGFSDSTINTVLAQRRRMYAERSEVWQQLRVYNTPISTFETSDQAESRITLLDGVLNEATDDTTNYLLFNLDTVKSRYVFNINDRDYFSKWANTNGLWDSSENGVKARARSSYEHWLRTEIKTASEDARTFATGDNILAANANIQLIAQHINQAFYNKAFTKFDELFEHRLAKGIAQLQNMDPLPAMQPASWLGRIGRRGAKAGADEYVTDRKALEYAALSDFLGIAQDITKLVSYGGLKTDINEAITNFKSLNGLTSLAEYVKQTMREQLNLRINATTAAAFFEQFESDLDARAQQQSQRTRRGHTRTNSQHGSSQATDDSQSSEPSEPTIKWRAETVNQAQEPYTIVHGSWTTVISYNQAALANMTDLTQAFNERLKLNARNTAIDGDVLDFLFTDLLSDANIDNGEGFKPKRVMRRLISAFHSDVFNGQMMTIDKDDEARQAEYRRKTALATSAGVLYGMFDEGHLLIGVQNGRAEVKID